MLSNPEGRLRPEPAATPASFGFRDGLGERRRRDDASGGVEILCIRQELAVVPSFEFALRERASRLASFHHPSFARVRAIERALEPQQQLLVVSDLAPGTRLSALLSNADSKGAVDTNAALCLLRQLVGAVAALHETARDAAHGAIAPERLVVTANGRLVIVEYVLGSALEQLLLSRERYWSELRVALPRMAGLPRFDHLTDVTQVGSVGLALLLGRTLKDEESPTRITDVLGSVKAVSPRGTEPLQAPLRAWFERALQLDPRQSFPSAIEARASLDKAIAESGFDASQTSLDGFLARVSGTERPASGPVPRPVQVPVAQASATPVPQPAAVATPRPMPIPQPAAASTPRPMPIPQPAAASTPRPMPVPSFAAAPTPRPAPIPAYLLTTQGLAESVTTQGLAESAATHGLTDPWAAAKTPRPQPAVMFGSSVTETEIQEPAGGGKGKWLAMAAVAAAIVVAVGTMGAKSFFKPAPAKPVTGKLSISTDPAGARVTIDGSARGATPLTVELSAGSHKVELHSASGTRSMPVVITAGTTSSQYVDLPKAASTVGQMRIRTEPAGARITLDGTPRGASPQLVSNLTPGEHTVQVDSDLGSVTQTVTVEAGSTASVLLTVAAAPEAPAATSGWISVTGKLQVQVFENGELLGTSETTKLMLATGKHDLELVNDAVGYRSARSVQVAAGKVSPLTVEPPSGSIALNAVPWAEVWIDGDKVGETPIGNFTLPVGSHEVVFKHPELGEQKVTALVTLKEQARVSADLRKK